MATIARTKHEDEMPQCVDGLRFFAGPGRVMEGKARARTSRTAPRSSPASRSAWWVRSRLELPADDGHPEDRPGPRHRQHDRPQAGRDDAVTTVKLAELAGECLPKGVLNVITGHGKPAGSTLVTHPDDVVGGLADQAKGYRTDERRVCTAPAHAVSVDP